MNAVIENSSRLANATPAGVQAIAPAERLPLDSGNNPAGQICLANEARFTSSFASEPLTNYATGWIDTNNIEKTLDFLYPPVQAPRRFEFKKADNAEAFYSEADDVRAIGADFKHVEYKGTSAMEKTLNKGLTVRVDLDQVAGMPNWRELYTARLLQRLLRNELRRAVSQITTAATNVAKTWDTTNGKDPDQDVLTEIATATDSAGVRPNRVMYGDGAWTKRLLSHRAQSTAGGYGSAGFNFAELAAWFGVDAVMTSRERWQSGATKTKILSDLVLLFFAEDGLTLDDPSNTKRFWTPVDSGVAFLRTTHNLQKNNHLQDSEPSDSTAKQSENPRATPSEKTFRPEVKATGRCANIRGESRNHQSLGMRRHRPLCK